MREQINETKFADIVIIDDHCPSFCGRWVCRSLFAQWRPSFVILVAPLPAIRNGPLAATWLVGRYPRSVSAGAARRRLRAARIDRKAAVLPSRVWQWQPWPRSARRD